MESKKGMDIATTTAITTATASNYKSIETSIFDACIDAYIKWTGDPLEPITCETTKAMASTNVYLDEILTAYEFLLTYMSSNFSPLGKTMMKFAEKLENVPAKDTWYNLDVELTASPHKIVLEIARRLANDMIALKKQQSSSLTHQKRTCNFADIAGFCEEGLHSKTVNVDHRVHGFLLKIAHDCYFYLGDSRQMLDSLVAWMPYYTVKQSHPYHSYFYGMLAFALEENNHFERAYEFATLALDLDVKDAWAAHALAHVYEMTGKPSLGIARLYSIEKEWTKADSLACHNYWHTALYHIENMALEKAYDIWVTQILPRAKNSKAMLDIVDAISLAWRLNLALTILKDQNNFAFLYASRNILPGYYYNMVDNLFLQIDAFYADCLLQTPTTRRQELNPDIVQQCLLTGTNPLQELKEKFEATVFNNMHWQMLFLLLQMSKNHRAKKDSHEKLVDGKLHWYLDALVRFSGTDDGESEEMWKYARDTRSLLETFYYYHDVVFNANEAEAVPENKELQRKQRQSLIDSNSYQCIGGSNAQRDIFWLTFLTMDGDFVEVNKRICLKTQRSQYLNEIAKIHRGGHDMLFK